MEFVDADVMKKKMSFGLSVADEKIKLIDISSEDDYFLVDSPFCDNFLQSASFSELERMEQKEPESRPSFLRRSLAWDSAFSNSAGVLDAEELSSINNGFINSEDSLLPADHEVRNRKSESTPGDHDLGFSADWFEIEPSVFKFKCSKELDVVEKSPKSGLKQTVQSSRKADKSSRNKMKPDRTWVKNESSIRRSDNKNIPEKSNLKMDCKSVRTGLAAAASSLYKRKTDLKKPHHSPSSQTSKISEKKKGMGNAGLLNQQFCSPPARSLTPPIRKQRRSIDSKDVKEASHLQRRRDPLSCGKQNGSLSVKGIRPNIRNFDESISSSTRNFGSVRNRKMSKKAVSEETASNRTVPKNMLINTMAKTGQQDQGKKELEILCKNLEAVALGPSYQIIPPSASAPSSRTPLAERRSNCNSSRASALRVEPKKERLMQRASSVRHS